MGIKFGDIEDAYLFLSTAPEFSHQAVLCKKTGKIFYESEYDDENDRQTQALKKWCADNEISLDG